MGGHSKPSKSAKYQNGEHQPESYQPILENIDNNLEISPEEYFFLLVGHIQ
jgi:hypothetical protein